MNYYINIETLEYPITEKDIRKLYPNVSFPIRPFVAPNKYAVVFTTPKPDTLDIVEVAVEGAPSLTSKGTYESTWVKVSPFSEYIDDEGTTHTVASQIATATAKSLVDTNIRIQAEITTEVKRRLDDFAATRFYDSIISATTYISSTIPYMKQEGEYCVKVRGETWEILRTILVEVNAGTRTPPTGYSDVEGLMPVLEWPVFVPEVI